jgi:N-acetylglutamate synthase-like GNAT family acetyltransferase
VVIKVSGDKLLIRPATESDLQAALKLMAELGYPDLSIARFAEIYSSVQEHPAMTLIVAEDDGEVVGLASISRRPQLRLTADLITIDELVVADSARGLGVGRALLEHAKAMAGSSGARRLELETNRARESYRRRFYIKNGFTEADSAVMRIDYDLPDDD